MNKNATPIQRICKICGEPEENHHQPNYLIIPDGCVCDWKTWNYHDKTELPPACDKYEGDGSTCENCEHDAACHASERPTPRSKKPISPKLI